MAWEAKHYKAIGYWAKSRNLRIALGSYPVAHFIDEKGKESKVHINVILKAFEVNKKEEERERRRVKQEEERNRPWAERFKQR